MSPSRRATIRDVAAEAGVSKSLVSLVFSGGRVSDDRRARVLAAAERLGFRPNYAARSLAATDGGFTGILVADLHHPALGEIVDAARVELARSGRSALLTAATMPGDDGSAGLDRRTLHVFGDLRPRSIIVIGSVPDAGAIAESAPGIPIVVASAVADAADPVATVRSDDEAGMRLVVDHLVERGHARIAHVGGRGGIVAERRAAAYAAAMTAHGLGDQVRVADAGFSESAGYAAGRALCADPPTAIACVNDAAAVGVLAAADDAGARIAVAGYDDSPIARLRQVSLTSVDPHAAEIGRAAARRAIDAEEGRAPIARETLVEPALVVRASTAA
ncbi:LacI family DNA-binding transcriptional regulator [Microbacterium karelineae]|uniref:LacI family DNA-binding transcriptional regulator n=1 Tax=Microbacterium karelineae TaxID=2654283 RepID=UPI0012E9A7F7|nr:LacI family DNA-binding transcriptional regulator [Microbacterium karelineae]